MPQEILIQKVEQKARRYFEDAPPTHDWSHVERVDKLSTYIGQKEGANLTILRLATLLHDIGRKKENKYGGKICHAKESARLAKDILKLYGANGSMIKKICHCIEAHRFRKRDKQPQTIEAKVLHDADKLDSIGAIGIARSYSWSGEYSQKLYSDFSEKVEAGTGYAEDHTPIKEFHSKLIKVKDTLLTEAGKKIAQERHDFTVNFFERLQKEVSGEL